jgi:hypothetical protein
VAERGARNTAVTRATDGRNIIWNTTPSLPRQPVNTHAGLKPDCPKSLPAARDPWGSGATAHELVPAFAPVCAVSRGCADPQDPMTSRRRLREW